MASDWVIEMQMQAAAEAEEEKAEWIREQLGDPDADEDTEGWDEWAEQYDMELAEANFLYVMGYSQDDWHVSGKSRFQIFNETIESSREILSLPVSQKSRKNLLVMVYGYIIAAVEAYLASTFIDTVMSSENFLRKLIESDPEFAKRKFTMKEIFSKQERLKEDVTQYLKDLVFHNITKVKPMFKNVLNIDFGDVKWLFEAVELRHHCVHRAGYNKDGNEVDLDTQKVQLLMNRSSKFVAAIEEAKNALPVNKEDH